MVIFCYICCVLNSIYLNITIVVTPKSMPTKGIASQQIINDNVEGNDLIQALK